MWTRERVQDLRARLGMSQSALSREIDMDVQTVQAWCQGLRVPSKLAGKELDRLARRKKVKV